MGWMALRCKGGTIKRGSAHWGARTVAEVAEDGVLEIMVNLTVSYFCDPGSRLSPRVARYSFTLWQRFD